MNRPLRRIGANIAFLLLDGGMAFLGFRLAYWARYELQIGRAIEPPNYLPFDRFLWIGLTLVALVLLLLGGRGFYRLPRGTSWSEILAQIGGATTVGVSILIVLLYGTRTLYTRLLYAYAWLAIIVTLSVGRFLVSRLQRWLWQQGIGAERVLVVGAGPLGQQVIRGILQQPQLGYFLVGYLEANPLPVAPLGGSATSREVPRYLGRVEDLSLLLEPCNIDEVIIALPSEAHQTTLAVAAHCRNEGIEFRVAPDLYEMSFDRVDVAQLAGVPLIGLKEVAIRGWNLVLKRAMDIILSLMTIAVAWPLMGLIAVLIKLDSPGPVLYRQKRIGRKGRPFTVFKFRTMRQHAELEQERLLTMNEATGPLFKIRLWKWCGWIYTILRTGACGWIL